MSKSGRSFRKIVEIKKNVKILHLKADIADIIVEPHDEPRVIIYGYVYAGRPPKTSIQTKDDHIDVNITKEAGEGRLYSVKVKMIVPPDKIREGLEINVDIGDIRIDGLPLSKISLKTTNGDILLGGISGNEIVAETMNGDILLRGGDYKSSFLTTVNGDIRIEVSMDKNYKLNASAKNGKIKIGLPINSSVKIYVSTVKGRISISNKDKLRSIEEVDDKYILTAGEGEGEITLNTLNGDISINLLKEV